MTYLVDALAGRDGREIALAHYRQRANGADDATLSSTLSHMPPNRSTDVVRWVLQVRGKYQAAVYVVIVTERMREVQELLDLPLSTVSQVVAGLSLSAGPPALFDDETRGLITSLARQKWPGADSTVLGPDW